MGFGVAQVIRLGISAVVGLLCFLIGVPAWAAMIISLLMYFAVAFSVGLYALAMQSRRAGQRQQPRWAPGPPPIAPPPAAVPPAPRYRQPPQQPSYGRQGYGQNGYPPQGPYGQPSYGPYQEGYDEEPYAGQPYVPPQQGGGGWGPPQQGWPPQQ